MMKCLTLGLIAGFWAFAVSAQEIPDDASLIELGTRTFDLRTDVRNLRRDDDFIPMTEIPWLRKLIKEDALLDSVVMHIRVHPDPLSTHWPTNTLDVDYPLTRNIPDFFVVDGYQTRSSHPSNRRIIILPESDPLSFYSSCSGILREANSISATSTFCDLSVTYRPDPHIRLYARIYRAKPPFNFHAIATRMREIAYCLDVTDQLRADGTSQAEPVIHLDYLPDLRNCSELVS